MKIKSLLAAIFSLFVFQMTQTTLEIRFINSITAAEALERGISDQITVNITYEHFDQTYQNARLLTTSRPIAFNTKPILPRGRGARGSIVLPLESGDKLVELFILVHLEHGEFFGWKLTANMLSQNNIPLFTVGDQKRVINVAMDKDVFNGSFTISAANRTNTI